ncbi:hypothetical protein [Neorhodopirellula pilleata]|uniref:Uncharacterized protein n=1 Tax=Neorhodopirellula pilleata TaxID=2714738 RepID=A0A5C6A7U6_9BACT|nr:hypothetical protein [Neorhodopirellula pilleata]TWT95151.1 hypothetical protein Pla100_37350 [Neorhodopirellula pilleata]
MTEPIFDHDRLDDRTHDELKRMLHRIVSMLTRLIARSESVAELPGEYNAGVEYEYREYGYREAEYEYKYDEDRKPEPRIAPKDVVPFFSKSISTSRPR